MCDSRWRRMVRPLNFLLFDVKSGTFISYLLTVGLSRLKLLWKYQKFTILVWILRKTYPCCQQAKVWLWKLSKKTVEDKVVAFLWIYYYNLQMKTLLTDIEDMISSEIFFKNLVWSPGLIWGSSIKYGGKIYGRAISTIKLFCENS